MGIKSGCNNMEKNKILRHFDAGQPPDDIAKYLRLTPEIVNSIVNHYRKGGKDKKQAQSSAKEEFVEEDFD